MKVVTVKPETPTEEEVLNEITDQIPTEPGHTFQMWQTDNGGFVIAVGAFDETDN